MDKTIKVVIYPTFLLGKVCRMSPLSVSRLEIEVFLDWTGFGVVPTKLPKVNVVFTRDYVLRLPKAKIKLVSSPSAR